jgi:uncharacterized protein with ATP-grasp and redox domains
LKLGFECPSCLLNKGSRIIEKSTDDPMLKTKALFEIVEVLHENLQTGINAAQISTLRGRAIRKATGNPDPYRLVKEASNAYAISILHKAAQYVESGRQVQEKFRRAYLCAAVGNAMQFDIEGYTFQNQDLDKLLSQAESQLRIDHTDRLYDLAKKAQQTLLLTDNAGEIVFDTLLVEQLKNMGLTVTYVVKGGPVLNDATLEDVEFSGMDVIADKILTTGTDAVGLALKEVSPDFLSVYDAAELVFAKGMGYAETLTEYKLTKPHLLLFRTKCVPVANYFCAPREKNIAKMMP